MFDSFHQKLAVTWCRLYQTHCQLPKVSSFEQRKRRRRSRKTKKTRASGLHNWLGLINQEEKRDRGQLQLTGRCRLFRKPPSSSHTRRVGRACGREKCTKADNCLTRSSDAIFIKSFVRWRWVRWMFVVFVSMLLI